MEEVKDILKERMGLSDEMLSSLLDVSQRTKGQSPSTTSPSSISVSLQSSLFEDEEGGASGNVSSPALQFVGGGRRNEDLVEELEALKYEKKLLEMNYKRMEQTSAMRLRETAKRHEEQVSTLKDRIKDLEMTLPQLRTDMIASREDFHDLNCTASQYNEMKRTDPEKLSLREYVLMRVFEHNVEQRTRTAEAVGEVERIRKENAAKIARADDIEANFAARKAKYEKQISELQREVAQIQDQAAQNKDKFLKSLREIGRLQEDGQMHASLRARCNELETDLRNARQQHENMKLQFETMKESESSRKTEADQASRDLEIFRQDKAYLQRELDNEKNQVSRLKLELGRGQEKLEKIESRLEQNQIALHETREKAKTEYEEKLMKEVNRLRDQNKAEISQIKELQLKAVEREAKALRVAKEESVAESEHLRTQLDEVQRELGEARNELAKKDAVREADLSQLRSELNRRMFEIESLSNSVETKMSALRKIELENEMLHEKLEVLRGDFMALETTTSKSIVEKTAKLVSQEEKLNMYEALEMELDSALLEQAKQKAASKDDRTEEQDVDALIRAAASREADQDSISALKQLPIAAQRRVKHSIALAQKLIQTERILESTKLDIREKDASIKTLKRRLEEAERRAEISAQPQSYLVNKIKQLEEDIDRVNEENGKLRDVVKQLQGQLKDAKSTANQLYQDLQKVLNERRALEEAVKSNSRRSPTRQTTSTSPIPALKSPTLANLNLEETIQEVDAPDHAPDFDTNRSMDSSTFFLHRQDDSGIPLPKWYSKHS